MTDPVNLMSVSPPEQCLISGESLAENSSSALSFIDSYVDAEVCDEGDQTCPVAWAGLFTFLWSAHSLEISAEVARKEGRLEDAIEDYKAAAVKHEKKGDAIQAASARAQAYYLEGVVAFQKGYYASASSDFSFAILEAGNAQRTELASAILREAVGKFEKQIEAFIQHDDLDGAFSAASNIEGLAKKDPSVRSKADAIRGHLYELTADSLRAKGETIAAMSDYRMAEHFYGLSGNPARLIPCFDKMIGVLREEVKILQLSGDDASTTRIRIYKEIAQLYEKMNEFNSAAVEYRAIADIHERNGSPLLAAEAYGEQKRLYDRSGLSALADAMERSRIKLLLQGAVEYREAGLFSRSPEYLVRSADVRYAAAVAMESMRIDGENSLFDVIGTAADTYLEAGAMFARRGEQDNAVSPYDRADALLAQQIELLHQSGSDVAVVGESEIEILRKRLRAISMNERNVSANRRVEMARVHERIGDIHSALGDHKTAAVAHYRQLEQLVLAGTEADVAAQIEEFRGKYGNADSSDQIELVLTRNAQEKNMGERIVKLVREGATAERITATARELVGLSVDKGAVFLIEIMDGESRLNRLFRKAFRGDEELLAKFKRAVTLEFVKKPAGRGEALYRQ